MPRIALWLLCAAYVLPGLFGRDPWKSADVTAFGYMFSIAQGRSSWLAPTVGGLPPESALLPYWLGAAFIKLFGPWLGAPLAARLPFALLLALVLVLTWYSAYHLARTEAAQPLPLAFGGEAKSVDYARAIADGAVLALIATLGLLQLGHETTPELVQLGAAALMLYALAASPYRRLGARTAVMVALPGLVGSGAPAVAMALGAAGLIVCLRSSYPPVRRFAVWIGASMLLAALLATAMAAWTWRIVPIATTGHILALLRLLLWFTWPAGPLALWTLWRWRRQVLHRHLSVPLPCSPALAASMAAFRASRLVCSAISRITRITSLISSERTPSDCTISASPATDMDIFSTSWDTDLTVFSPCFANVSDSRERTSVSPAKSDTWAIPTDICSIAAAASCTDSDCDSTALESCREELATVADKPATSLAERTAPAITWVKFSAIWLKLLATPPSSS